MPYPSGWFTSSASRTPRNLRRGAAGRWRWSPRTTTAFPPGDGQPAELYRLALEPVAPLLRPAIPFRVGILPGCVEPVTGATLTRDGRLLAVTTTKSVRVFETDFIFQWSLVGSTTIRENDVEGITWDGLDLLLVSEDRSIYRLPQSRWRSTRGAR